MSKKLLMLAVLVAFPGSAAVAMMGSEIPVPSGPYQAKCENCHAAQWDQDKASLMCNSCGGKNPTGLKLPCNGSIDVDDGKLVCKS